jgi:type II secretory pathway component GspD/PulD (secretin)
MLINLLVTIITSIIPGIIAAQIPIPTGTDGSPVPAVSPAENMITIVPANDLSAIPDQIPPGTVCTNLEQALKSYATLSGKTIVHPASLKATAISVILRLTSPLTRLEACEGIEQCLVLNGLDLTNSDNGFLRVVPATAEKIQQVQHGLDQILAPPTFTSEIITIKHAHASEVANTLNDLVHPEEPKSLKGISAVAAERGNSVLIIAPKDELEKAKKLVAELDLPPRPMLIEAAILSVELPKTSSASKKSPGPTLRFLGHDERWLTNLVSFSDTNTNSEIHGFSYVATLRNDLNSMITALCLDRPVNILQKPRLLTADGKSVSIFVGESLPYPPGHDDPHVGGPGCCFQPLQTGIGLEFTPSIKSNGLIALNIDETVDRFEGETEIQGVGKVPNTVSSRSHASLIVRDGDIIMLGGELRTNKPPQSGSSFLTHIPLLGSVFRGSTGGPHRTELVLLVRAVELPADNGQARAQLGFIP